jgi:hypothetical protein
LDLQNSADGLAIKTVCEASISCTATNWHISARVKAFEADERLFTKPFIKLIPRDCM